MLKTKGTIYDFFTSMSAIVMRKSYWEEKKGNEAIDCWVYAHAALQLIKEKYPAIRTALAKPSETPPEPYQSIDMSHRSDPMRPISWSSATGAVPVPG